MIYVGTSGFSYAQWKGTFYPEKLPAREFLSFYARHFSTTEINNTFYRSPSAETTAKWASQVPEGFRFTLKLNRKITHQSRLQDVGESMEWFLSGAEPLQDKLGTILVQLPPYFHAKNDRLAEFLEKYSGRVPMALEFRHPSWFSDETFGLLETHSTALVLTESDELPATRRVTGPFVYARLRKSRYKKQELSEWARWIHSQGCQAFVYFKHEVEAPRYVGQLTEALDQT